MNMHGYSSGTTIVTPQDVGPPPQGPAPGATPTWFGTWCMTHDRPYGWSQCSAGNEECNLARVIVDPAAEMRAIARELFRELAAADAVIDGECEHVTDLLNRAQDLLYPGTRDLDRRTHTWRYGSQD